MKKILKWLGIAVVVVVVVIAATAAYVAVAPIPHYPVVKVEFPVEVTPERVARGKRSVEMLCAGCHMDSATFSRAGARRSARRPSGCGQANGGSAIPPRGSSRRDSGSPRQG